MILSINVFYESIYNIQTSQFITFGVMHPVTKTNKVRAKGPSCCSILVFSKVSSATKTTRGKQVENQTTFLRNLLAIWEIFFAFLSVLHVFLQSVEPELLQKIPRGTGKKFVLIDNCATNHSLKKKHQDSIFCY